MLYFKSMPSKSTEYSNRDRRGDVLEPKRRQHHQDVRPPALRILVQKNPRAGKPVSSLRSTLHAPFSLRHLHLSQVRPGQCQGGGEPVLELCSGGGWAPAVSGPQARVVRGQALGRPALPSAPGAAPLSAAGLTSPAPRPGSLASACFHWSGASQRWLPGSGSSH